MRWRGWIGAALLAAALFGGRADATAEPRPLPAPVLGESRLLTISYLHDPAGDLDIGDVAVRDDLEWEEGTSAFSRTGPGIVWLRLPPMSGVDIIDLGAIPDRATLYEAAPGAFDWRVQETGDTVPLAQRAMAAPQPAFRLSPQVTPADVRFIRIEQPNWLQFQVTAWTEPDFQAAANRAQALRILILGFVIAIIAYNLVVSVLARDRLFAFNALTIASFVLLDLYLTGVGAAWVWPGQPWLSNIVLSFSIAGIVFFGSRFMRIMLAPRDGPRTAAIWIERFGYAALALAAITLITPYWMVQPLLLLVAFAFLVHVTVTAFLQALAGQVQARLLLVPLCLSVVPGIGLLLLNIWTTFDLGWLSAHLLELTLMLEALCFSLVLATRMRLHRAEAIEARAALIEHRARAAERFTNLQDQERARIAADLHDSLGHSLALASAQFEMARREEDLPQDAEERLSHGLASLRGAIAETRRISHALHPTTLIHLGWQEALRTLTDEFSTAQGIETELAIDCPVDLFGENEQVHLLRLVQEALTNVARHADAAWCRVLVRAQEGGVRVAVEDDGNGVGKGHADSASSLGLFSMRQRAARLGGELRIGAREGGGTEISFEAHPSEAGER